MCKIIRRVLLVCLTVLSLSGCKPDHRVVYENFKVTVFGDTSNVAMSCRVSLDGTAQYAGRDETTGMSLSYVRSPYTVFVSFRFPKEQSGVICLQELLFFENDTLRNRMEVNLKENFDNKTEFRRGGVPQIREEDESRASFLIRQVDIPHSKQKVLIRAVISTDQGDMQKTWEFELVPVIKEELRNDLLDSIMSV